MRGRKLTGSAMGAVRLRIDIPRLIELYRIGRLKLDELVSGHYPFEQINEALESSEKGEVIRNVLMFQGSQLVYNCYAAIHPCFGNLASL